MAFFHGDRKIFMLFEFYLMASLLFSNEVTSAAGSISSSPSMVSHDEALSLRDEVRGMFYHAYDSYMLHAFPLDELRPMSCSGEDSLGGYALTLVDAMDTLALLGNHSEFSKAVLWASANLNFDLNKTVSVFETNIRVLGGLLSAHLLASDPQTGMQVDGYNGELLSLAQDLANRMLPAFETPTGIPYGSVDLRQGVLEDETKVTSTAGGGTLTLEFGVLSRLTGNPVYERVARNAVRGLWSQRSSLGLVGAHIDVFTGDWTHKDAGIGTSIDSFYEYLLKAHLLFGDEEYLHMFKHAYKAVMQFLHHEPWYLEVNMNSALLVWPLFNSLQAFWPGLQVLIGDVEDAVNTHRAFYSVWKRFGFTPEGFNLASASVQPGQKSYPLRPELAESTYWLFKATNDPLYLEVGRDMVASLRYGAKCPCGYCHISDVETHEQDDHMESFFLAETVKYLWLLFDLAVGGDNIVENGPHSYVFSTEGHLFPLSPEITLPEVHCSYAGSFCPSSSSHARSYDNPRYHKQSTPASNHPEKHPETQTDRSEIPQGGIKRQGEERRGQEDKTENKEPEVGRDTERTSSGKQSGDKREVNENEDKVNLVIGGFEMGEGVAMSSYITPGGVCGLETERLFPFFSEGGGQVGVRGDMLLLEPGTGVGKVEESREGVRSGHKNSQAFVGYCGRLGFWRELGVHGVKDPSDQRYHSPSSDSAEDKNKEKEAPADNEKEEAKKRKTETKKQQQQKKGGLQLIKIEERPSSKNKNKKKGPKKVVERQSQKEGGGRETDEEEEEGEEEETPELIVIKGEENGREGSTGGGSLSEGEKESDLFEDGDEGGEGDFGMSHERSNVEGQLKLTKVGVEPSGEILGEGERERVRVAGNDERGGVRMFSRYIFYGEGGSGFPWWGLSAFLVGILNNKLQAVFVKSRGRVRAGGAVGEDGRIVWTGLAKIVMSWSWQVLRVFSIMQMPYAFAVGLLLISLLGILYSLTNAIFSYLSSVSSTHPLPPNPPMEDHERDCAQQGQHDARQTQHDREDRVLPSHFGEAAKATAETARKGEPEDSEQIIPKGTQLEETFSAASTETTTTTTTLTVDLEEQQRRSSSLLSLSLRGRSGADSASLPLLRSRESGNEGRGGGSADEQRDMGLNREREEAMGQPRGVGEEDGQGKGDDEADICRKCDHDGSQVLVEQGETPRGPVMAASRGERLSDSMVADGGACAVEAVGSGGRVHVADPHRPGAVVVKQTMGCLVAC